MYVGECRVYRRMDRLSADELVGNFSSTTPHWPSTLNSRSRGTSAKWITSSAHSFASAAARWRAAH